MIAHLQRIVDWLRAGYPHGIPERDYVPLFALLNRRLGDDEARALGDELVARGIIPADKIDVGVGYLRATHELPSDDEMRRVMGVLRDAGWSLDEAGDGRDHPIVSPPSES